MLRKSRNLNQDETMQSSDDQQTRFHKTSLYRLQNDLYEYLKVNYSNELCKSMITDVKDCIHLPSLQRLQKNSKTNQFELTKDDC